MALGRLVLQLLFCFLELEADTAAAFERPRRPTAIRMLIISACGKRILKHTGSAAAPAVENRLRTGPPPRSPTLCIQSVVCSRVQVTGRDE